jgi:hypothetical protein
MAVGIRWRWVWGLALVLGLCAGAVRADSAPPAPSVVGLARANHLYLPGPTYAPPEVYPEGKLDWDVISALIRDSATAAGIPAPWTSLFQPNNRVAVMIDTDDPPVPIITVEAVLDELVQAGVSPDHLFIFSSTETGLFAAGFSLRSEGPGVHCYGADAMGYRGGLSRLVLDDCDKIVNLAVLRPHRLLGMSGALANYLNAVDAPTRMAFLQAPDTLGSLGLNRQLASRVVLNFLDCTHPYFQVPTPGNEAQDKWEYRGMLCSRDAVAADAIGREILEDKRGDEKGGVPWPLEPPPTYLQAADDKYHLGEADPAQIKLVAVGDQADALVGGQ